MGELSLFNQLSRRGLIGNRASSIRNSRQLSFRQTGFSETNFRHTQFSETELKAQPPVCQVGVF